MGCCSNMGSGLKICFLVIYILIALSLVGGGVILFLFSPLFNFRTGTVARYNTVVNEWISNYYPDFSTAAFTVETNKPPVVTLDATVPANDKLYDSNPSELKTYDGKRISFQKEIQFLNKSAADIRLKINSYTYVLKGSDFPQEANLVADKYDLSESCKISDADCYFESCKLLPLCSSYCSDTLLGTWNSNSNRCSYKAYLKHICVMVYGSSSSYSLHTSTTMRVQMFEYDTSWLYLDYTCYRSRTPGLSSNKYIPANYSVTSVDKITFEVRNRNDPFIWAVHNTSNLNLGTPVTLFNQLMIGLFAGGGFLFLMLILYVFLRCCGVVGRKKQPGQKYSQNGPNPMISQSSPYGGGRV